MSEQSNPLISFAVICYRQERFIAEAVLSALTQTYSPLEIIISDDCSPDATFDVVRELASAYQGPHKIILNRNLTNLGLAENVNKVWALSSGELVVFQGGDDISLPIRTHMLVAAWRLRTPRPDLVYSAVRLINEQGLIIGERAEVATRTPDISDTLTGRKPFVAGGCAAAYARCLQDKFGPLDPAVVAEDFVYSFRAMLGNGIVGIPQFLVMYRQHPASIIGEFLSPDAQGKASSKLLQASLECLHEYKKAMDIAGTRRFYLRWRLARRIKSLQVELDVRQAPRAYHLGLIVWALFTFRPRVLTSLLQTMLRQIRPQSHAES